MILSMVAAVGKNRELGKNNALLWNIPEDMQYFRDTTRGHVVIMGQRTFESIGRPLPKRVNIVLTQDKNFAFEGVIVAYSLKEALLLAEQYEKDGEAFVIGGAMVYSLFLPKSDRLYLTLIDASFPDADVFFPEYEGSFGKTISDRPSQDENFQYRFVVLER